MSLRGAKRRGNLPVQFYGHIGTDVEATPYREIPTDGIAVLGMTYSFKVAAIFTDPPRKVKGGSRPSPTIIPSWPPRYEGAVELPNLGNSTGGVNSLRHGLRRATSLKTREARRAVNDRPYDGTPQRCYTPDTKKNRQISAGFLLNLPFHTPGWHRRNSAGACRLSVHIR